MSTLEEIQKEAEVEAESEESEPVEYDDDYPPIAPDVVEAAQNMSPETLKDMDDLVIKGMALFFDNKFKESEDLFRSKRLVDPLIANAYSTVAFVRACMSFEPADIKSAQQRLKFSAHFAKKCVPKKPIVQRFTSMFKKADPANNVMPTAHFRSQVVVGESECLNGILFLLQEKMTSIVKAGLALRRAYIVYDALNKYIEGQGTHETGADANSLGGMYFGLGAIHVTTSMIPPKLLTILKALGYMHDRELGFKHLNRCLASKTLRSPMASLFMLCIRGLLPSFAVLAVPQNVGPAEEVIQQTLDMYPRSVIHLWLAGRVSRLKKQTPKSMDTFRQCVEFNKGNSLPQLTHLALYDLAWCHCSRLEWTEARTCFETLERESSWSKPFYAYAQGCCEDMLGNKPAAISHYDRSITHPSLKLSGKKISIDQYVERKVKSYRENSYRTCVPGIELAMHFNMVTQATTDDLAKILDVVAAAENDAERESLAVLSLIRANICREIGKTSEAKQGYIELVQMPALEEEKWVKPYALYEFAVLKYQQGQVEGCRELLQRIKKDHSHDYNFEMQMQLRLHFTNDLLPKKK